MDGLDPYLELAPESLLTNFDANKLPIYEEAIKMSNFLGLGLDLYISKEAYWCNGYLDINMHALHTNSHSKDHSDFWFIFERVSQLSKYNVLPEMAVNYN